MTHRGERSKTREKERWREREARRKQGRERERERVWVDDVERSGSMKGKDCGATTSTTGSAQEKFLKRRKVTKEKDQVQA